MSLKDKIEKMIIGKMEELDTYTQKADYLEHVADTLIVVGVSNDEIRDMLFDMSESI